MATIRILGDQRFQVVTGRPIADCAAAFTDREGDVLMHESDVSPPPETLIGTLADGTGTQISPLDVYRRSSRLEELAHTRGVDVKVWIIFREAKANDDWIAVCSRDAAGHDHVFIARNQLRCRLQLIAIGAHEIEHCRRGDPGRTMKEIRAGVFNPAEAEEAATSAADREVRRFVHVLQSACDVPLQMEACVECCRRFDQLCAQGADAYAAVQQELAHF